MLHIPATSAGHAHCNAAFVPASWYAENPADTLNPMRALRVLRLRDCNLGNGTTIDHVGLPQDLGTSSVWVNSLRVLDAGDNPQLRGALDLMMGDLALTELRVSGLV